MYAPEHILTWTASDFRLELYDTNERDDAGRFRLAYEFYHGDQLIFEGNDFCTAQAVDSNQTVAGLLTFLSCKPGDTDREYFESYTPEQLEWAETHGEELSYHAMELKGVR